MKNNYQHDSKLLFTFVPNNSFGSLEVLNSIVLEFDQISIFNSEFSYMEVWFTDQNSEPLK